MLEQLEAGNGIPVGQASLQIRQDRADAMISCVPFLAKGPKSALLLSEIFSIFRRFPACVYDLLYLISQSE